MERVPGHSLVPGRSDLPLEAVRSRRSLDQLPGVVVFAAMSRLPEALCVRWPPIPLYSAGNPVIPLACWLAGKPAPTA